MLGPTLVVIWTTVQQILWWWHDCLVVQSVEVSYRCEDSLRTGGSNRRTWSKFYINYVEQWFIIIDCEVHCWRITFWYNERLCVNGASAESQNHAYSRYSTFHGTRSLILQNSRTPELFKNHDFIFQRRWSTPVEEGSECALTLELDTAWDFVSKRNPDRSCALWTQVLHEIACSSHLRSYVL